MDPAKIHILVLERDPDVVKAVAALVDDLLVDRRLVVFRLDELDHHVPRETHRDAHVGRGRLTPVALLAAGEAVEQKERTGSAVLDPPIFRLESYASNDRVWPGM